MGTKKRKAGRPLQGKAQRERYTVTLEPETVERIREWGKGNLSGGIDYLYAYYVMHGEVRDAPWRQQK